LALTIPTLQASTYLQFGQSATTPTKSSATPWQAGEQLAPRDELNERCRQAAERQARPGQLPSKGLQHAKSSLMIAVNVVGSSPVPIEGFKLVKDLEDIFTRSPSG
jgi:hypothetical protein